MSCWSHINVQLINNYETKNYDNNLFLEYFRRFFLEIKPFRKMAKTFFLQTMSLIFHRYAAFFYRKMFCSLSMAVHVHIISKILLLFPPYLCVWIEILEKSLWYGLYSIVFSCFISILFWKGTIKTYCLNICFLHFFLDNEIFI